MKRLSLATTLACLHLLVLPLAAATPPAPFADSARTVQFAVAPLLNARAVTTLANGSLVTWNKGIDGTWSALATRAAADAMGSAGHVALPDDATFAANAAHPLVVLHFSNADATGSQVRFSDKSVVDSYSFRAPEHRYTNLSLYFMSAFGTSDLTVTLAYADGSTEAHQCAVEDWGNEISETGAKFILATNLAKWGPANTELEKDHHYLLGLSLAPDASRTLVQVTVTKPASDTTLTFWGATGYLAPGP